MFKILSIDESYNSQMLPILEASPIQANGLSLYFDKSPNIFEIARMKYTQSEHLGFFRGDELMGFASLGYYDALIKGKEEQIFTFYNFYLKPEARGRMLAERAMKEFLFEAKGKANYGISVTLKGNRKVESYVGRHVYDWMPPIRIIDELAVKSIFFSLPKKNRTNYTVRNAQLDDIPEMIKLLNNEHRQRDFGAVFQEDNFLQTLEKRGLEIENYFVALDKKGEIKGVCLAWDCSSFRRTRVMQFSSEFYPALYSYKVLEKFLPMAPFPKEGEAFNELTITDYAAAERNETIIHALLSEIYHRNLNRKYHFMNFASCLSDPILKATNGFLHKSIISHILFSSLDPERYSIKTKLPYIDIAFL